jgi:ribosomal protein L35AE/L33A
MLQDSLLVIELVQKSVPKECILKFPNVKSLNAAAQLIGRKVAWPVEEHKIKGKIVA